MTTENDQKTVKEQPKKQHKVINSSKKWPRSKSMSKQQQTDSKQQQNSLSHLQLKSFDARVDVRVCEVEVFSSPHGDVELPVGLVAKHHSNVVRAVLPFHVQSAAVVYRTVSSATCGEIRFSNVAVHFPSRFLLFSPFSLQVSIIFAVDSPSLWQPKYCCWCWCVFLFLLSL